MFLNDSSRQMSNLNGYKLKQGKVQLYYEFRQIILAMIIIISKFIHTKLTGP